MRSYSELLTEASLDDTKGIREIYGMNSSTALENLVAFKVIAGFAQQLSDTAKKFHRRELGKRN